jgi:hypothetical protein
VPYADFEQDGTIEFDDDDDDDEAEEELEMSSKNSDIKVLQLPSEENSNKKIKENEEDLNDDTNNYNDEQIDTKFSRLMASSDTTTPLRLLTDDELEDLDDDTILKNVFANLAGKKTHVSLKDLLNWDFVIDLIGEV